MIHDRGTIKWNSLMLPEHVKALREWDYHTRHDREKPDLSDHQLDRMNFKVWKAIKFNENVKVSFYDGLIKQQKEITGKVALIPGYTDRINVVSTENEKIMLFISDILEINRCR